MKILLIFLKKWPNITLTDRVISSKITLSDRIVIEIGK